MTACKACNKGSEATMGSCAWKSEKRKAAAAARSIHLSRALCAAAWGASCARERPVGLVYTGRHAARLNAALLSNPMIDKTDITGLILAGGRGSRMGGIDKGLQNYQGMPMAMHALLRLSPQVGQAMVNANRNLGAYEAMGVPVWPDNLPDFAGPLAGLAVGLERCETPYLATVPCDCPRFPLDLVERLAQGLVEHDARSEDHTSELQSRENHVCRL